MKRDNRSALSIRAAGFSAAVLGCLVAASAPAAVVTFDDLSLAPDTYFRASASTTFTSGNATFFYDAPFGACCWSGFSYSNRTDTTSPGFGNDGSAITGDGVGPGQDNYAVSNADGARLEFSTTQAVVGAYFSNATYSFLAMRDGNDGNSPAFVKGPFGPGDFFTLTVTGYDAANASVGSLDIALADGASILAAWTWVDLASLGLVKSLGFSYASSDMGAFGVNTPSYFAMDNLTTVPAPGAVWLLATGLASLSGTTVLRRKGGG